MRFSPALALAALVAGTPLVASAAGPTDLTPCRGVWKGEGKDPWLDDDPYPIEVTIYGGKKHCASVKYIGLCTAQWEDCVAGKDHVTATERLIERGECAEGSVTLRCPDPKTLELRWEGEPGVMVATLTRELPTGDIVPPPEPQPQPDAKSESKPDPKSEPKPDLEPVDQKPDRSAGSDGAADKPMPKQRGCLGAPVFLALLLVRRRKDGPLHRQSQRQ